MVQGLGFEAKPDADPRNSSANFATSGWLGGGGGGGGGGGVGGGCGHRRKKGS